MQKSCQAGLDTGNFTMVKLAPQVLRNRNTCQAKPLPKFCQYDVVAWHQIAEHAVLW